MTQFSIQAYFESQTTEESVFRYAFSLQVNSEDSLSFMVGVFQQRFEKWYICVPEISPSGNLHIQGYGETETKFSLNERKKYQKKGVYYKYINQSIMRPLGMAFARGTRMLNVFYCLKQAECVEWYCTEHDENIRQQMVEASRQYNESLSEQQRKKIDKSVSYESKMIKWYVSKPIPDRPQDIRSLVRLICEEGMVPWQYCDCVPIVKIARKLLLVAGNASTKSFVIDRLVDQCVAYDEKLY